MSNEHNNAPAVLQVQPDTFYERNAKFREENWQIRFDAAVEARRQAQEQLYAERERHAREVQALHQEISRLLPSQPAVPQDMRLVPVWLLERVERSLGAFTSDEGWAQTDMDTMDSVSAMLAATPTPEPAQEFNKSVADAEIKAMYVESQGSDKGWLGIEGSYFIGGVVAARRQKKAPAPAQEAGLTEAQPMQPIILAGDGVIRFKKNKIVDDLYELGSKHGLSLNDMVFRDYSQEDRNQFAQLIGYSVSGWGDLSYALNVEEADAIAALRAKGGNP